MTLPSGFLFGGRFDIDRMVASGGMGVIYRARDCQSGQWIALKLLIHEETSGGPEAERFIREAQLLAQLRHPSIVGYVSHGQTAEGQLYLATEWLDGEDLSKRLSNRGLTLTESIACMRSVAAGLQAAHERGIVHRDVKPGNLFLRDCRAERTAILDFGIARPELLAQTLTATGMAIGTPNYMAPEQARGERNVGPAADIFSMGCVLFQCLTGRLPFFADQPLAVLTKILSENAPSVRSFRPEISEALDDLLKRMLAKDPRQRPQNGGELRDALDALGNQYLVEDQQGEEDQQAVIITGEGQKLLCVIVGIPAQQTLQTLHEAELEDDEDEDSDLPTMTIAATELPTEAKEDPIRTAVAAVARSYNAQPNWLPDGSLVLTVVGKGSATDLVQSAGRCALLIARSWPGSLVSMATGRGLVTRELPVGEAVDRAFKLVRSMATERTGRQSLDSDSKPELSKTVLIDEISTGLLDGRCQLSFASDGQTMLIGELNSDEGRRLLGKPTPCVGREQELNLLAALVASCQEDSESHAVLTLAEAGLGKSRLKHEFLRRLEAGSAAPLVLSATGDMHSQNVPYSLIAQALRRLCEMQEGLPAHEQRERITARFGHLVEPNQQRFVCEFIGEICGVSFPDDDSPQLHAARLDPRLMNDQIVRAVMIFLAAVCKKGLVIIALDDLQWGDSLSVQLTDAILRDLRNQPILILGLGRPEVKERFPGIWKVHKLKELPLKGLSKRSCQRLVQHVLGKEVASAVVDRIIEQADGNMLFLEELIRAIGEGRGDVIPESVMAMVQSRLAILPLRLRRVLLAASVFGLSCWVGGVGALTARGSKDVSNELEFDELEQGEFLEPQKSSRHAGQKEYSFRSAMFREAAYGLLLDEERRTAHRLAAGWLEGVGESDPMILALHSELGGLMESAVSHYLRAAELALQRNAMAEAISTAQRGKACGAVSQMLGGLIYVEAVATRLSGRMEEALSLIPLGLEVLPPSSRYAIILQASRLFCQLYLNQLDAAKEFIDTLLLAEPAPEDRSIYVRYCMMVLALAVTYGVPEIFNPLLAKIKQIQESTIELDVNLTASVRHGESDYIRACHPDPWQPWLLAAQAAEGHEAAGDRPMVLSARIRIGQAAAELGDATSGIKTLREVAALATQDHNLYYRVMALIHLSAALLGTENIEAGQEAEKVAHELLAIPNMPAGFQGWLHGLLAQSLIQRQQWEQAEAEANIAMPLCQRVPLRRLWVQTLLASCRCRQGQATVEAAQQLIDELNRLGCAGYIEVTARLAAAEQFHAAGDLERGNAELRETVRQIQRRLEKIPDATWRTRYLNNVVENRRARQLARQWLDRDPWQDQPSAA